MHKRFVVHYLYEIHHISRNDINDIKTMCLQTLREPLVKEETDQLINQKNFEGHACMVTKDLLAM